MVVQAEPPHFPASGERLLEDLKPDPKPSSIRLLITDNHRPLSEPTTAAQPWWREWLFVPRSRPSPGPGAGGSAAIRSSGESSQFGALGYRPSCAFKRSKSTGLAGLVRNSAAPYSIASSVSSQSGKAWTPLNTGNIVPDLWSDSQLRNRAKREAWNEWTASRKGLAMVWNLRAQLLETYSCNMLCSVGTASASWVLTRPLPSITNRRR